MHCRITANGYFCEQGGKIFLAFKIFSSDELTKLFMEDDDDPVDLFMPRMKCVSGQWLVQLYEYLEDNPHITVHGFRHAGI